MAGRNPSPAHLVKPSFTSADTRSRTIGRSVKQVSVLAVTNDADDFITLPSLVSVQEGHQITILCNAGGAFELRTPAGTVEEINSRDCGTAREYLCTDTRILRVTKISTTIGWEAHEYTAVGVATSGADPHTR
jgi:hypothetical protein